ncbi:GNAT family N-acetyltransferase [Micromonospora echinaurantiaca]|uniref:GNAT family N-acetyltransferase n=1 Tax=Micromonospora echinaurantiaca TaxID=47857 RepID=UPI003796AEC7
MIKVRRAGVDDAWELVRLRGVMLAAMNGREPEPGRWQDNAAATLRERLAGPGASLAAFVVAAPDGYGELASCAVGTIERRLGGPDNPSGEVGYVFNVATDPRYRRRGYSPACMEALLAWYRRRAVTKIDLRASADGEPLYRALGFVRTTGPTMRLSSISPSRSVDSWSDGGQR